jgi:hypothetical protein
MSLGLSDPALVSCYSGNKGDFFFFWTLLFSVSKVAEFVVVFKIKVFPVGVHLRSHGLTGGLGVPLSL